MKKDIDLNETKYEIRMQTTFKKQLKKAYKQGKDINKLKTVLLKLANGEELEEKYLNHKLINDKYYKDCYECHIEPNWLLIYTYIETKLVLVLVNVGTHNEILSNY